MGVYEGVPSRGHQKILQPILTALYVTVRAQIHVQYDKNYAQKEQNLRKSVKSGHYLPVYRKNGKEIV